MSKRVQPPDPLSNGRQITSNYVCYQLTLPPRSPDPVGSSSGAQVLPPTPLGAGLARDWPN